MTEIVDPITKKHLLLLAYKAMDGIDYDEMHRVVKEFQDVLEKRYGKSLGYKFQDESIYSVWDNDLQFDLESYDCYGIDVTHDNNSLRLKEETGETTIKIFAKPDLEIKFHDKRITKKLLKELNKIKKEIAS
ncbi:MAG: hypothetical protein KJ906_02210 [Nanoarchaeota archaeon]|nr:hypothetical protein [Nanoarchaeota archaeon]